MMNNTYFLNKTHSANNEVKDYKNITVASQF